MRHKKKYYKKHSIYDHCSNRRYTARESIIVRDHAIPDIDIAKMLGRSLIAIQIKRYNMKKKGVA